jgi:hypothetical protein
MSTWSTWRYATEKPFLETQLESIALKDIVLKDVVLEDGRLLVFIEPIVISPTIAEDKCLTADINELEIYLWGEDTDALINDFRANIGFAWDKYACASDEGLSEEALELKKRLLACLQEKPNR